MPRHTSPSHLTLLLPRHHSRINSPSSTPTSATLTPGTVIFDSDSLYTPTSPAKPQIYASYLPVDDNELDLLLAIENSALYDKRRKRLTLIALLVGTWIVGVLVLVVGGWVNLGIGCRRSPGSIGLSYIKGWGSRIHSSGMDMHGHGHGHGDDVKAGEREKPIVKMTADGKGYTISMPDAAEGEGEYPLMGKEYAQLCKEVEMMSMMATETRRGGKKMQAHRGYYVEDPGFKGIVVGGDDNETTSVQLDGVAADGSKYCERTLTYVVDDNEGRDVGIGAVVLGMWMAYGLAVEEGREFFVEQRDGAWLYGPITKYFAIPTPRTNCAPPPFHLRLPCPLNTPHKLITQSTYKSAFGHTFESQFEDARAMRVHRQKPIFALLRKGYEHLPLSPEIANAAQGRLENIGRLGKELAETNFVAVQIRRGDKYAREWKYHEGYIPVERYISVSRNGTGSVAAASLSKEEEEDRKAWPLGYHLPDYPEMDEKEKSDEMLRIVASDDSDIMGDKRIAEAGMVRSQQGALGTAPGGFWAEDMRDLTLDQKEREEVAIGYLLDFAVLTGAVNAAKDGWVVCGYHGDLCRMLAVGMGWESAIEKGHWVNIDGDFDWFGIRW